MPARPERGRSDRRSTARAQCAVRTTRRSAVRKRLNLPRDACAIWILAPTTPTVMVATMIARLAQNRHATMVEAGATSTHHWNGPLPDPMRRIMSLGFMNDTGDTLGSPPAIQVAAVRMSHGTIQSAMSPPLVPMSRHAWDRCRGAAAISQLHDAP